MHASHNAADNAAIAEARLQVHAPAIGLLVLDIIQLLTVPVIFAVIFAVFVYVATGPVATGSGAEGAVDPLFTLAFIVPVLVAALGVLTIAAALKMKQL